MRPKLTDQAKHPENPWPTKRCQTHSTGKKCSDSTEKRASPIIEIVNCKYSYYITMKLSFQSLVISLAALAPRVGAWTPTTTTRWAYLSSSQRAATSAARRVETATVLQRLSKSHDGEYTKQNETMNRRQVLQHVTATAMGLVVVVTSPAHAAAADNQPPAPDPLDQLGEALSKQQQPPDRPRWPDSSVSPIFPPTEPSSPPPPPPTDGSDLSKALEGIQKKRQIDPRTHG